jgi:hypothetical protein
MAMSTVKFNPERGLMLAATAVALVTLIVVLRGGGYGIGGLSWDSQLNIQRSNIRLGSVTVLAGDRIHSVHTRRVHRDADLRGVLRSLPEIDLWLEVERRNFEVAVPLTPEAIESDDLPAVLRGPYQVVAIDGDEIRGDMNLNAMAFWMGRAGGTPSVFTVSVPDYTFEGPAQRVRRPGPIIPVVLLVFTLGAVLLARLRLRAEVMGNRRRHWGLVGLAAALGGILLAFLSWHDGFLADPYLLPFGLIALCAWRPVSLFLHQQARGELMGPNARFFRLGIGLPMAVLALAALFGWLRTLPGLTEAPLDGYIYDQLRTLVLLGTAGVALYHMVDLTLQAAGPGFRKRGISMIAAGAVILAACIGASLNLSGFLAGGYVPYLAGLVCAQWLGDLTLLPGRAAIGPALRPLGAADDLAGHLVGAAEELDLDAPAFACRLRQGEVMLQLERHSDLDTLTPEPIEEGLLGLLDLLDAEGGMFPRRDSDPFEGLDRELGIALILPLTRPGGNQSDIVLRAYLIGRKKNTTGGAPQIRAETLESWRQQFESTAGIWTELLAAAALGALTLRTRVRHVNA